MLYYLCLYQTLLTVNAIIIDDDEACRKFLILLISGINNLNLLGTFSSAKEALSVIKNGDVQIIFLDIEMPEMNGLEFLSSLEIKPQVILTTSHKEYAFDAFDHEVTDYLLKPITLPRLLKSIAKVEKNLNKPFSFDLSKDKDYFFIRNNSVITKVYVKEVLWIEALGDYVKVQTKEKNYVLHIPLKKMEDKLPASKFSRIHRSYIVQLDNVETVEDTTVYINHNPLPIGAVYREDFLSKLNLLS